MTYIAVKRVLFAIASLALAGSLCVQAADAPGGDTADYDALWLAAMGDLLGAARQPPATPGAPAAQPDFAQANAALNQHVARLLETLPPVQRLRQHLILLPMLAEATAALQAIADAAQTGQEAELEAARDWLLDSCARLRKEAAQP